MPVIMRPKRRTLKASVQSVYSDEGASEPANKKKILKDKMKNEKKRKKKNEIAKKRENGEINNEKKEKWNEKTGKKRKLEE